MKALWKSLLRATIWRDARGQDFIEYALLASFIAVMAAATFPTTVVNSISVIFSKMEAHTGNAAKQ